MSKQLKYKLKKTLKNAEFVHADLEYHQQLSQDAFVGFQQEINRLLALLSEEDRQKLQDYINSRTPSRPAPGDPVQSASTLEAPVEESDSTSLVHSDIDPKPEEEAPPKISKTSELKKLFRRIAEQTHPDKVRASGFSEKEILRLERIFKRAREAHDNENWYILYSIAIKLDLEIDHPTDEQVDWIEEDIKKTLGEIAAIANLTAWHWYIGDDEIKKGALIFYFQHIYNFIHPDL